MKTSGFLKLASNDYFKGAIMAILGAIVGLVQGTIDAGSFTFDWPSIGRASLVALIAYLTKNLFTNNKDQFAKKDIKIL